ncbi:ATP-binding protein [Paenibacillus arenilitoris]|uniref:ATP-binding protein n=1 Tax=Paenibacillus arenilitoris TaxID=2772299 RepID=A0A927CTS2_9BACL|nr:ATP-binding protein [Paenibacillus arenilitoris]MBD2871721.1 ATP-binding protein [Paenibacillus arenilitoris]
MSDVQKISAFPAKAFFVNMLTRDIELSDAILDLLDNCVDGVLRKRKEMGLTEEGQMPYSGYKAELTIDPHQFSIKDNCGGIPIDIAEKYAFRMGRSDDRDKDLPTVGMYGIGMKRAIFKIGRNCNVTSNTSEKAFEVSITPTWLEDDAEWELPLTHVPTPDGEPGTTITVTELYENIANSFSQERSNFIDQLFENIASQYSFIIKKGFQISINDVLVKPMPIELLFDTEQETGISPYVYSGVIDDVSVLLEVGFYRPTPSEDELEEDQDIKRTKDDSGWTIICNDRVVVYKDKTILTGWGEANVPAFHNQFIGISGVVIFKSNKAEKLPLTTTKRGLEASSVLYLQVKNYMREGTKIFTSYTNVWKKDPDKERETSDRAKPINVLEIPSYIPEEKWKPILVNNNSTEKRFIPNLPKPSVENPRRQIRFIRELSEIKKVAEYLFEDPNTSPADVGNACFDQILRSIDEE